MDKDGLKEIILELLEKYKESKKGCIYEFSGNIKLDLKELDEEIQAYKDKINV